MLCYMVVKHGSLTLREECRLRVFENKILRQIFGPKRDANWERRKLHSKKQYILYRSPDVVWVINYRKLRWTGHVARMEDDRIAFKIVTEKPTGKKPLGGLSVDGRRILK